MQPAKYPSGLTPASAAAVMEATHQINSLHGWTPAAAELERFRVWLQIDPAGLDYAQRTMGVCSEVSCNQPIAAHCHLCGKAICADHSEEDFYHGRICHGTEHYENRMRPGSRHTHSSIGEGGRRGQ